MTTMNISGASDGSSSAAQGAEAFKGTSPVAPLSEMMDANLV